MNTIGHIHQLLPCPLCSSPQYKDVHTLRTSLIDVATSRLNCPVCNEAVMGLDKLTIHLFSHVNYNHNQSENVERKSQCEIVRQRTVEQVVQNKIEKCPFPEGEKLINPSMEVDSLVCDICNFTFTDHSILELHQKLLHLSDQDKDTGVQFFHCHMCNKKFKMRGSLIVHLRVAHFGFANNNKVAIKNTENNGELIPGESSQQKLSDNKQWECDVCSKNFTTKYFLKKHKRLHTGEMPYTCTQCNKSFTFQQSYHKHMLYHSSEKPHICNECGRSFKELSTLQNHARIHSGERPFACETCDKRFRQRVSYLVHRRIHTGVMPYDCKSCGKQFRYKVSQRSHKCVPKTDTLRNSEAVPVSTPHSITRDENMKEDVQCFLSVDHDGKIDFIQKNSELLNQQVKQKFNSDSIFTEQQDVVSSTNNSNSDDHIFGALDLYSTFLSPLLSDVESLCLTNSSKTSAAGNDSYEVRSDKTSQFSTDNFFNDNNFLPRS